MNMKLYFTIKRTKKEIMRRIRVVQKFNILKKSMFKYYRLEVLPVHWFSVAFRTNCVTNLLKAPLWKCICGKTPIFIYKYCNAVSEYSRNTFGMRPD